MQPNLPATPAGDRPPTGGATAPAAAAPAPRGAVRETERSLAPDLARGAVLLFIALANVSTYLYGRDLEPGSRPVGGTLLDNGLDFLVTVLVDRRSYPMFALLFGYGMVQLTRRQLANGTAWPTVRRLLLRRQVGLLLFGALHTFLLFHGDILGPYGATGLIVLLLFRRSRKVLLWWTSISLVLLTALFGLLGSSSTPANTPTGGYLSLALTRLLEWGVNTGIVTVLLGLVGPMLIGVLMARAELLDRPTDHITTLRRLVSWAIPIGILGGIPFGLAVAGWWEPAVPLALASAALHTLSGVAAGVGYAALFGLWAAARTGRGRSGPVAVLAACGQRSLTCYLWQSVLFAPLLAAWGLGLGNWLPTTLGYLLAVLVWASGLVIAWLLARSGNRGPAETALRRITYGRPTRRPDHPAPAHN